MTQKYVLKAVVKVVLEQLQTKPSLTIYQTVATSHTMYTFTDQCPEPDRLPWPYYGSLRAAIEEAITHLQGVHPNVGVNEQ